MGKCQRSWYFTMGNVGLMVSGLDCSVERVEGDAAVSYKTVRQTSKGRSIAILLDFGILLGLF